jgi:hypothetical protein
MSLAGMKSTFMRCRQARGNRRYPSTAGKAHDGGDAKELFFVSSGAAPTAIAPDAEMMAVDIKPDPVFHAGVPHRLFPLKSPIPTIWRTTMSAQMDNNS